MNCPKCGSEMVWTGQTIGYDFYNCICGNFEKVSIENPCSEPTTAEEAVSKTELTTAEMLLWLVGKSNEGVFSIIQARDVIMLNFVIGKNHKNAREETLNEAIKQAYGWAKQEEQK